MNKNIFAFVALLAVVSAVPYGPSPYAPAAYAPAPAPSVAYQQLPVVVEVAQPKYAPAPASYYPAPAPLAPYTGPSVAYNQLPLVAPSNYGQASYAAPAPISYNAPAAYNAPAPISYKAPAVPLIAAPSNPRATASANANSGSLLPGSYSQLAIPSYNIVSAEPAPEADVGANYGLAPSLLLPNPLPAPAPKAYY